jgi:hypothetical protein
LTVHSDWCVPFMIYLKIAGHYTLLGEELFRRSANGTLL